MGQRAYIAIRPNRDPAAPATAAAMAAVNEVNDRALNLRGHVLTARGAEKEAEPNSTTATGRLMPDVDQPADAIAIVRSNAMEAAAAAALNDGARTANNNPKMGSCSVCVCVFVRVATEVAVCRAVSFVRNIHTVSSVDATSTVSISASSSSSSYIAGRYVYIYGRRDNRCNHPRFGRCLGSTLLLLPCRI
ncbi:chitinase [Anopheles sinensis]|uniref:Chitinase n=1 Tax=Anopheles sinensis TaxID=74873 RepID=A0A084VH39_ANOSI|nr:chitinase [Anopheles sinensis]